MRPALFAVLLALSSCSSARHATISPTTSVDLERPWEPLKACSQDGDRHVCPSRDFSRGLVLVFDLWHRARALQIDLNAERDRLALSEGTREMQIRSLKSDLKNEKSKKWKYGALGFVAGSVVTVVLGTVLVLTRGD